MLQTPNDEAAKAEVLALADEMFTREQVGLRQRASGFDEKLVRNLKEKFGSDVILVLGNWSAANTKYHEPTRNKSLIHIFTVHLIDEFKTSSKCPKREDDLENFKVVKNPQPYKRLHSPTVKCRGLLRYITLRSCRRLKF
ncbi:hypothetical protein HPULCUR_003107 [Helicostylum pulchrum]|uniref:Uncharacterized protein n=1 Tax=Helicostylum pulchrum TaxID=562976 RepID=A0ABP9XSF8_9FUNG